MISFVGMGERSSGVIRGMQLAQYIGGNFIDKRHAARGGIDLYSHVVMVRSPMQLQVVRAMQSQGIKVGLDILDVPGANFLFHSKNFTSMIDYLHGDIFDFYIVNNSLTKSYMSEVTSKPCFCIPHHNVNFEKSRTCFGGPVKKVGYLGLPEQIDRADEIAQVCADLGLEFCFTNETTREGCVTFLSTVDVGIIFLENSKNDSDIFEMTAGSVSKRLNKKKRYEHLTTFKPNTKLSNFQSFGIPTLCSEYQSFKEWGGQSYVSVADLLDIKNQLVKIKSDAAFRKRLSDSSYQQGQNFHIENICEMYRDIVRVVR